MNTQMKHLKSDCPKYSNRTCDLIVSVQESFIGIILICETYTQGIQNVQISVRIIAALHIK